jgi:GMP synthase-like glutamine amidotransferase
MRVHVLQHVPFEGLGSIDAWLAARGIVPRWTRFFESADLPRLDEVDFLIALGGPMSVNDERELPWLIAEKRFVAQAIGQGKSVLGICLGAQLIASALGCRVYPAEFKEIGWFPVRSEIVGSDCFAFPDEFTVFHWHGETFDLPPSAVHLARSAGCRHQAFQIGRRVIGLQFHLETTAAGAEAMMRHAGDELRPARFIQSAEALRATPATAYAAVNAQMARLLDYLA